MKVYVYLTTRGFSTDESVQTLSASFKTPMFWRAAPFEKRSTRAKSDSAPLRACLQSTGWVQSTNEEPPMKRIPAFVLLCLLCGGSAYSLAQGVPTGTVSGTTQDASGGVMPGVTVTITSQDRGFSRSAVTDQNGRFLFPSVPIGIYLVAATLQGFDTAQSTGNVVETDKTTAVPF